MSDRVRIRRDGNEFSVSLADGSASAEGPAFPDGVLLPYKRKADGPDSLREIARALFDECVRTKERVLSNEDEKNSAWNENLGEAGFRVYRKKLFVERDLNTLGEVDVPFTWRTLAEIGDAEFLDRLDRAAVGDPFTEGEPHDPEREYQELLDHAGEHLDRDLWRVAILDGEEVGVVLPQSFGEDPPAGTLSYVAVLPEHRGRGLGGRLHLAGLSLLAGAGILRYKGSTDVRNVPMARVFAQNGCEVTTVQVYYRA